jgi:mercuric ion binding protein
MKTLNIILVLAFVCTSLFAVAQAKQTTVKVYGNCGMCKKHIETAAKEAGATSAVWNKDTKVLSLKFDASKTDSKKIQTKIAEAGYDTQDATATKEAYDKLDECCQYDRKEVAKPTSKVDSKNCCANMASCTKGDCASCSNCKDCAKDCCKNGCTKSCCKPATTVKADSKNCCSDKVSCTKDCCKSTTVNNSASDKSASHSQVKSLTFTTVNGDVVANTAYCCAK